MSGKAIDSVPPAGTVRDVTRRKCEGHGAEFAASLLGSRDAFAAPKAESCVMGITRVDKCLTVNDLVGTQSLEATCGQDIGAKSEVQNNAY
jgi:hypothetical protein